MADLDALLAQLDDDDADVIRQALAEKDAVAKRVNRDLQLATDKGLRERFPRAFKAYELKRLDLGDAAGDDLIAIMKAKEEELAELGVPAGDPAPAPVAAPEPEPVEDPAAAFGTPVSGGQPTGARNLTQEFLESMKADSPTDRAKMVEVISQMQGNREQIDQLTDILGAKDRGPRGLMPW